MPLPKILILGVGNLLLKDEGIGIHAIRELEKSVLPENVQLLEAGTVSHQFLPLFNQIDYLIVIDALEVGDRPGLIYKFSPEDIKFRSEQKLSLHQMSLMDILNMVALTGKMPKTIIFGIQPEDVSSWSLELSDTVRDAIPRIKELILAELKKINADQIQNERTG
ncbi:MAG: HyaD/HybD family hydrogenase maturation endopeptidase [Nitrospirota bacterium]